MKKKLETYTATVDCDNCKGSVELEIPKGTRVDNFARDTDCPNCGCRLGVANPWYYGSTCTTGAFPV